MLIYKRGIGNSKSDQLERTFPHGNSSWLQIIRRSNYSPYTVTHAALHLGRKSFRCLFWVSPQLRIRCVSAQVHGDPPGCRDFPEVLRAGTISLCGGGHGSTSSLEPHALPVWTAAGDGGAWLASDEHKSWS